MEIQHNGSFTFFKYYTKALFAYDVYFQIRVTLKVNKNGKKIFRVGIKAVPLKTKSIDLQLKLRVSSGQSRLIFAQKTLNIENHDGTEYETRSYDFFRYNKFKIVLGNIQIDEYNEKNYETLDFKILLPSENNYEASGIVFGDYKWYQNYSPKRNLKGKESDFPT